MGAGVWVEGMGGDRGRMMNTTRGVEMHTTRRRQLFILL